MFCWYIKLIRGARRSLPVAGRSSGGTSLPHSESNGEALLTRLWLRESCSSENAEIASGEEAEMKDGARSIDFGSGVANERKKWEERASPTWPNID